MGGPHELSNLEAVYDHRLRVNGSVERKSLHAFNLIGFEAIRITIWPKRTKIAPIFWGGNRALRCLCYRC